MPEGKETVTVQCRLCQATFELKSLDEKVPNHTSTHSKNHCWGSKEKGEVPYTPATNK